jgi:hypothetical protein
VLARGMGFLSVHCSKPLQRQSGTQHRPSHLTKGMHIVINCTALLVPSCVYICSRMLLHLLHVQGVWRDSSSSCSSAA